MHSALCIDDMWRWTKIISLIFAGAIAVWLLFEVITFPNISKLREENPTTTSLIEYRLQQAQADGKEPRKFMIWVPIEQISPNLQKAVMAGEDARFFQHNGFDWDAIQKAWNDGMEEGKKQAKEECEANAKATNTSAKDCGNDQDDWIPPMPDFKRGASTISQQLAKNLFLSENRSFVRKGREAVYTYFLERDLSKKRILELYLNVIEWGDGIYGAEAASRNYFKKSASDLTKDEAAFLAAMIPSPLNIFNPATNRKRVVRRQKVILRGMNSINLQFPNK